MNVDLHLVGCALDFDLSDASARELLFQKFAKANVLVEEFCIVPLGGTSGYPRSG